MHTSTSLLDGVIFALCKEFNTPVSLGYWLRYKYDQRSLLDLSFHPSNYLESAAEELKRDYAVVSSLSKYKGFDIGIDLEQVALQKFKTSELSCEETNRRLKRSRASLIDPQFASILYRAKRKIANLLGPCSLLKIEPFFGWGPGATFDMSRRQAQVDKKLTTIPMTVSGRAMELLHSVIRDDLHWSEALLGCRPEGPWCFAPGTFAVSDSCRVTTVPKSFKTDRVIAIEPTGNLFLQKGVGGYLRKKLKGVGVDLDNQAVNQDLARNALGLSLATLDLSAASDSVSIELIKELVPPEWADLLDSLRSHCAEMPDGTIVRLQKLSSMGNGFTFEVESLIFWALGSSVVEIEDEGGILSVYGDDIIVSQKAADLLVRVLDFAGFKTNTDKTFTSGLFFESCGKHYFCGQDVTPFYQKEELTSARESIRFHNRILRWSDRVGVSSASHLQIRRSCPDPIRRCRIPYGADGDDGFLTAIEELDARSLNPNFGFKCTVLRESTATLPGIESALLALSLRRYGYQMSELPVAKRHELPSPLGAEPSYGDIQVPLSKQQEETWRFGHRWIIPPGYCPLPTGSPV